MGYTVYWISIHTDTETFNKFVKLAKELISLSPIVTESTFMVKPPIDQYGESFFVSQYKDGFCCCNSRREPYTDDIFKCLIIMVELGMAKNISADDTEHYYEILDFVNTKIPLTTYEYQKNSFRV